MKIVCSVKSLSIVAVIEFGISIDDDLRFSDGLLLNRLGLSHSHDGNVGFGSNRFDVLLPRRCRFDGRGRRIGDWLSRGCPLARVGSAILFFFAFTFSLLFFSLGRENGGEKGFVIGTVIVDIEGEIAADVCAVVRGVPISSKSNICLKDPSIFRVKSHSEIH